MINFSFNLRAAILEIDMSHRLRRCEKVALMIGRVLECENEKLLPLSFIIRSWRSTPSFGRFEKIPVRANLVRDTLSGDGWPVVSVTRDRCDPLPVSDADWRIYQRERDDDDRSRESLSFVFRRPKVSGWLEIPNYHRDREHGCCGPLLAFRGRLVIVTRML